jgi:hypothetical protein
MPLNRGVVTPPPALVADLRRGAPGQIINLHGLDTSAARRLDLEVIESGGPLLYSNDPETYTSPNRVLAREPALPAGPSRVFFHHQNGTGRDQKLAVVVRGGPGGSWLAIRRRGLAGPWSDPLPAGRRALYRWLSDGQTYPAQRLAEGETAILDPALAATGIAHGLTVSGIIDLDVFPGGPPEMAVVACDPEVLVEKAYPSLAPHPRTGPPFTRGTSSTCDRQLNTSAGGEFDPYYDTSWGVAFLRCGDGLIDPNLMVSDHLTPVGGPEPLPGNYGLLYRIHLWVTASDRRDLAVLVNPRGMDFGGAIKLPAGIDAGGEVYLPWSPDSLADPGLAVIAGRFVPGEGIGLWMQFMIPGGANAPVNLALVPYHGDPPSGRPTAP